APDDKAPKLTKASIAYDEAEDIQNYSLEVVSKTDTNQDQAALSLISVEILNASELIATAGARVKKPNDQNKRRHDSMVTPEELDGTFLKRRIISRGVSIGVPSEEHHLSEKEHLENELIASVDSHSALATSGAIASSSSQLSTEYSTATSAETPPLPSPPTTPSRPNLTSHRIFDESPTVAPFSSTTLTTTSILQSDLPDNGSLIYCLNMPQSGINEVDSLTESPLKSAKANFPDESDTLMTLVNSTFLAPTSADHLDLDTLMTLALDIPGTSLQPTPAILHADVDTPLTLAAKHFKHRFQTKPASVTSPLRNCSKTKRFIKKDDGSPVNASRKNMIKAVKIILGRDERVKGFLEGSYVDANGGVVWRGGREAN
ncbi:hypothetical protein HDU67_003118, partial [Dinochytrium kinnereticum]